MDATLLSEAIGYLAADRKARIINMSLSNEQNNVGVSNTIEKDQNVLFVVAAGNAKIGAGRSLDFAPLVFPARYGGPGGDHKKHLVTVGATNVDGTRAKFSNFSDQFVDLLAPGCAIETRDDVGNTVMDNGTSPATAIVTFASSLVASLGLDDARAIKNRLLVSTDFNDALADTSWSSGVLNIVRAISLRNDVVRLTSSDYLFGEIADRDSLRRYCDDENMRVLLSNVKKIVPNISRPGGTEIEYWTEADRTLKRTACPQVAIPDDDSIGMIDGAPGPSMAKVQDITFATFP